MPIIALPTSAVPTTALSDLLRYVLPQVPSCPDDVAEFNLLQAAMEFCRRTTILRAWQAEITTTADATRYEFQLEENTWVAKLLMVKLAGQEVEVKLPEVGLQLDAREANGPYAYGELDAFQIRPQPAEGLALLTYSALMPSDQATGIPTALQRYFDTIANGAKGRLLHMKSSDWYDPTEGDRLRSEFMSAVASARVGAYRGHAKVRRSTASRFY